MPPSNAGPTAVSYNDGDWVESCTALVEHADGRMEILDWAERLRKAANQVSSPVALVAEPAH